jgi:hypothetical protein
LGLGREVVHELDRLSEVSRGDGPHRLALLMVEGGVHELVLQPVFGSAGYDDIPEILIGEDVICCPIRDCGIGLRQGTPWCVGRFVFRKSVGKSRWKRGRELCRCQSRCGGLGHQLGMQREINRLCPDELSSCPSAVAAF